MGTAPRVSFYPLQQDGAEPAAQFACRLAEKAYQLGHRVHLLVEDEDGARLLDELLWQVRAESFVPHQLLGQEESDGTAFAPVTIGTPQQQPPAPELLINLTDRVWERHADFCDIREIVPADPAGRTLGRERFREYKALGYSPEALEL